MKHDRDANPYSTFAESPPTELHRYWQRCEDENAVHCAWLSGIPRCFIQTRFALFQGISESRTRRCGTMAPVEIVNVPGLCRSTRAVWTLRQKPV
jgi:hypothetical protein